MSNFRGRDEAESPERDDDVLKTELDDEFDFWQTEEVRMFGSAEEAEDEGACVGRSEKWSLVSWKPEPEKT